MRVVKWALVVAAVVVAVSLKATPAPQAPAAAAGPQLDQCKRNVGLEVDAMGEHIQKMNDMVFSFAEPGFQEFETSKYVPLIRPTDTPAIWLNKERMEKYRPEMKKTVKPGAN